MSRSLFGLLVSVYDPAAAQVVGTQLHHNPVVGQDTDVVHPHFPADMSENLVPVVQLHPEEGVWQGLDNRAFNLNGAVFLGHILRVSLSGSAARVNTRLCVTTLSAWPPHRPRGLVVRDGMTADATSR